jgi:hypothetical protein
MLAIFQRFLAKKAVVVNDCAAKRVGHFAHGLHQISDS